MRLFSATIATEIHTFSPLPTSLDANKESVFLRPGEHPSGAPRMCTASLFVARQRACGGALDGVLFGLHGGYGRARLRRCEAMCWNALAVSSAHTA